MIAQTDKKHAPGPWDVDHIPARSNNRALFYSGSKDKPDFHVHFAPDISQPESEAISVRLQAAPDMLATLRYIENHCRELWEQDDKYRAGIAYILDAAETAIAKATAHDRQQATDRPGD